jgi:RHS repeat-associated protein
VPAEAQLRAVYVYDVYNRRTMSVLVGESVRYYAWDGWRNVVEAEHVYDGTSPATWQAAPVKQFVWGAELDELVSYRRKVPTATVPAWETYYLLHGGQETAAKLVDANGEVVEQYEYDPYGRATVFSKVAGQWTSGGVSRYGLPFLWKAVRLDEVTGLLQMRNRYYSVETGRFLSGDPIGVWGDLGNLGNEYGYAWGRPLVVGDALGLQGSEVTITRSSSSNPNGGKYKEPGDVTPEQFQEWVRNVEGKMRNGGERPPGDPNAGKLEKIGFSPDVNSGRISATPDLAVDLLRDNADMSRILCNSGPNETGGYVVEYLGTLYLVREGRNPRETPSGGQRVACWDKAQYLATKGFVIVAGMHTHPGGSTFPSSRDKESAKERNVPEIIIAPESGRLGAAGVFSAGVHH